MQKKVQESIQYNEMQRVAGRIGVISSYNSKTNTASVMLSGEQTDEISDIIQNVMCPRVLGLQTVSPNSGDLCWVIFKGNNISQPLITQFYNHRFYENDYAKQIKAPDMLPSYLIGL